MVKNTVTYFLNFVKRCFYFISENDKANNHLLPVDDNIDYYIADNKRVYVIGDIHGCDVLLDKALDKMLIDAEKHRDKQLIFIGLGDYIDRGSNSKNVIDILLTKIPDYFEKIFLKGNHEVYMLGFLTHPQENVLWLDYGGREALISYGVKPPILNNTDLKRSAMELEMNLPKSHLDFFKSLKTFHIIDDYFFVHAGVDPEINLMHQSDLALTSIRAKFMNYTGAFQGKKIIHGHTPIEKPDFQKHRINLDTGAYLTGNLTIGIFENNKVTIL